MSDSNILVCPSYCLDSKDVLDLISEFGPYEGRYVYQYPADWAHRLMVHVEHLNEVERLRIKEHVAKRMDPVLLSVKAGFREENTWEENVHEVKRFQQTLVVGDAIDSKGFKTWEEALPDIRDSRRRSWSMGGSLNDFIVTIDPLMSKAPACYLIDRHFNPLEFDSHNLLRAFFERVGRSTCYEIHIITRYEAINEDVKSREASRRTEQTREVIRNELSKMYSELIPRGRKLFIHLVREGREGGDYLRMHNRYFLTRHGALDISTGYKLLSQPHKQMAVHVVDRPLHEELKTIYIDGVTRFHDKNLPRKKSVPYPIEVDEIVLLGR